ncbi:MAG: hypothetical protein IT179_15195 [Acidobacteria bacterium]|nr:hypothetical protein [Acidobacteriota bacterium]
MRVRHHPDTSLALLLVSAVCAVVVLGAPAPAWAETRWAVIVSGASGGEKYAEQMKQWRSTLQASLVDRYGFDAARLRVLVDESVSGGTTGSAANVKTVLGEIRTVASADDLVLLILLGHGTYDGEVAKFNLVGPDMTAQEWNALLSGLPGRLIVVNTTAASFPFLEALKGKGRVVITATNSAAQKYATVFPEYLVKAISEASTDLDKNGRTSIFEVFEAASVAVKQHYEQRGQLTTERALLDDNGDGVGREEGAEGPDGGMARLWHLDAEPAAVANNPELAGLVRQQRSLEAQAEELKRRKGDMPPAEWQAEYEKLMLELAKVSQEIRKRG